MPRQFRRKFSRSRVPLKKKKILQRARNREFNKRVKKVITRAAETKHIDTNTITISSSSPVIQVLSAFPAEGTGEQQRVGDQIMLKSINVRWRAESNTADTHNTFRFIVFAWNNTAAPVGAGDIIQDTGSVYDYLLSPYNFDAKDRGDFIVMLDRRVTVGVLGGEKPYIDGQWNFSGSRLPHKKKDFNAATVISRWYYYVLVMHDSSAVPNPTFMMHTRTTFTDI